MAILVTNLTSNLLSLRKRRLVLWKELRIQYWIIGIMKLTTTRELIMMELTTTRELITTFAIATTSIISILASSFCKTLIELISCHSK